MIMKTKKTVIFFILTLILILFVSACGGKDDGITGKYTLTLMKTDSMQADEDLLKSLGYGDSYLELADGKFTMAVASDIRNGTYEEKEGTLILTSTDAEYPVEVISFENKQIVLDLKDGFVCTFTKK